MMRSHPGSAPAEEGVVVPVPSAPGDAVADAAEATAESVHHPAKVMRIGAMVRQLLEEVRAAPLDEASRQRMREIYDQSIRELNEILSPELQEELGQFSLPFEQGSPSEAELRVAHAQLVGWLEGLFHGIQAMLFAQQVESRQRLEELRRKGLPAPAPPHGQGTYL